MRLRRLFPMMKGVKRWYYIVLGGILLTGGLYIYLHRVALGLVPAPLGETDTTLNAGAGTNAPPASPARIFWQKVNRSKDGFRLEMPSDSKEIQIPAYTGEGGSEQVHMLYAYPDAQTSFSIAWADNPPVLRAAGASAEKALDTARDDALARTQTSLVTESKGTRGGFPSRDFVGRNSGGGIFNARIILANQRLYMLMASFPSANARRPQDVARFFDSFAVIGGNQ